MYSCHADNDSMRVDIPGLYFVRRARESTQISHRAPVNDHLKLKLT